MRIGEWGSTTSCRRCEHYFDYFHFFIIFSSSIFLLTCLVPTFSPSIVHAHLAYISNRTYVVPPLNFQDEPDWHPLSAFVRGALVGSASGSHHDDPTGTGTDTGTGSGSTGSGKRPSKDKINNDLSSSTPLLPSQYQPRPLRAVSRAHFERACPEWSSASEVDYKKLMPEAEGLEGRRGFDFDAVRQDELKVSVGDEVGDGGEGSGGADADGGGSGESRSNDGDSDTDTHSDGSGDSPHGDDNSTTPSTDISSSSSGWSVRGGPTYLTISFTPLALALGFGSNPPADVIMRGWAGVLRPGGGRGLKETGGGGGGVEGGRSGGAEGGAGVALEAPGDALCVTVHPASEHVFDYR